MCRDPRVAISISDIHGFNQGRVIKQISEDADEHTERFAKKYLAWINILIVFPQEKESFRK